MKVNYTEAPGKEVETTLLEILNLENDSYRRTIWSRCHLFEIYFWEDSKVVHFSNKSGSIQFKLDTIEYSPEKINEIIESIVKIAGVTYED